MWKSSAKYQMFLQWNLMLKIHSKLNRNSQKLTVFGVSSRLQGHGAHSVSILPFNSSTRKSPFTWAVIMSGGHHVLWIFELWDESRDSTHLKMRTFYVKWLLLTQNDVVKKEFLSENWHLLPKIGPFFEKNCHFGSVELLDSPHKSRI